MGSFDSAFELITDNQADVVVLKIKSKLMNQVCDLIEDNNLTQAQAASILRVSQPRISSLKQGRISKFSIDMLIRFAILLRSDGAIQFRF